MVTSSSTSAANFRIDKRDGTHALSVVSDVAMLGCGDRRIAASVLDDGAGWQPCSVSKLVPGSDVVGMVHHVCGLHDRRIYNAGGVLGFVAGISGNETTPSMLCRVGTRNYLQDKMHECVKPNLGGLGFRLWETMSL